MLNAGRGTWCLQSQTNLNQSILHPESSKLSTHSPTASEVSKCLPNVHRVTAASSHIIGTQNLSLLKTQRGPAILQAVFPGSGKTHELVSQCWCFVLAQTANLTAGAQVGMSTSSLYAMSSPRPLYTACSVSITAGSATRSTLPAGDRDPPSGVPSVRF